MSMSTIALSQTSILSDYKSLTYQMAYKQSSSSSYQGPLALNTKTGMGEPKDISGITKIYPTKDGGREWFMNMNYPKDSPNFFITDNPNLTKLSDGSWRINASHVRMVVNTSENQNNWKDVEITGYVRLHYLNDSQKVSISNTSDLVNSIRSSTPDDEEIDDLVFISRSGRHSSELPCEGTAYNGVLHTDASLGWKKEIWHTGGYTDERARHIAAEPILGKWVGWKIVVYNIEFENKTTAVKLESYLDESNTNNWTKVTELIDGGGWYSNTNNSMFFSAGCDIFKDHICANAGPLIIFRTDNLVLDFKQLSIREIQPPYPFQHNLTTVLNLTNHKSSLSK